MSNPNEEDNVYEQYGLMNQWTPYRIPRPRLFMQMKTRQNASLPRDAATHPNHKLYFPHDCQASEGTVYTSKLPYTSAPGVFPKNERLYDYGEWPFHPRGGYSSHQTPSASYCARDVASRSDIGGGAPCRHGVCESSMDDVGCWASPTSRHRVASHGGEHTSCVSSVSLVRSSAVDGTSGPLRYSKDVSVIWPQESQDGVEHPSHSNARRTIFHNESIYAVRQPRCSFSPYPCAVYPTGGETPVVQNHDFNASVPFDSCHPSPRSFTCFPYTSLRPHNTYGHDLFNELPSPWQEPQAQREKLKPVWGKHPLFLDEQQHLEQAEVQRKNTDTHQKVRESHHEQPENGDIPNGLDCHEERPQDRKVDDQQQQQEENIQEKDPHETHAGEDDQRKDEHKGEPNSETQEQRDRSEDERGQEDVEEDHSEIEEQLSETQDHLDTHLEDAQVYHRDNMEILIKDVNGCVDNGQEDDATKTTKERHGASTKQGGRGPLSIFMGNIPCTVTPEVLYKQMQHRGKVVDIACDFRKGAWMTAFVTFSKSTDACSAIEAFNNRRVFKNTPPHRLVCCFAPQPPASLTSKFASVVAFRRKTQQLQDKRHCMLPPYYPQFDENCEGCENVAEHFCLLRDGPPGANLFVYGIPSDWTEVTFMRLCQEFGHIVGIRVPRAQTSGAQRLNKGFGFVSYDSTESSSRAFGALLGKDIFGKALIVQVKSGERLPHKVLSSHSVLESSTFTAVTPRCEETKKKPRKKAFNMSKPPSGGISGYDARALGSSDIAKPRSSCFSNDFPSDSRQEVFTGWAGSESLLTQQALRTLWDRSVHENRTPQHRGDVARRCEDIIRDAHLPNLCDAPCARGLPSTQYSQDTKHLSRRDANDVSLDRCRQGTTARDVLVNPVAFKLTPPKTTPPKTTPPSTACCTSASSRGKKTGCDSVYDGAAGTGELENEATKDDVDDTGDMVLKMLCISRESHHGLSDTEHDEAQSLMGSNNQLGNMPSGDAAHVCCSGVEKGLTNNNNNNNNNNTELQGTQNVYDRRMESAAFHNGISDNEGIANHGASSVETISGVVAAENSQTWKASVYKDCVTSRNFDSSSCFALSPPDISPSCLRTLRPWSRGTYDMEYGRWVSCAQYNIRTHDEVQQESESQGISQYGLTLGGGMVEGTRVEKGVPRKPTLGESCDYSDASNASASCTSRTHKRLCSSRWETISGFCDLVEQYLHLP